MESFPHSGIMSLIGPGCSRQGIKFRVFMSLSLFVLIPESHHFKTRRVAEQAILDGFGQEHKRVRGDRQSSETLNTIDQSVALHCVAPKVY
jgi:hypothetical protein